MTLLTLPTKQVNKGFARLDREAIIEALDVLDIDQHVKIKWANGRKTRGTHRYDPFVGHVITISTYLDAARLTHTLWHELAHAHQHEELARDGVNFTTEYKAELQRHGGGKRGYENNRYEIEAEALATYFTAEQALATHDTAAQVRAAQAAVNHALRQERLRELVEQRRARAREEIRAAQEAYRQRKEAAA